MLGVYLHFYFITNNEPIIIKNIGTIVFFCLDQTFAAYIQF